jgi:type I restriction enzyme S subunit
MGLSKLGCFIEQSDLRNSDGALSENSVVGLSTAKRIITTKADLSGVRLTSYKVMPPQHFAYVPDTSRRGDKMSLGYNADCQPYLVSSISVVFKVNETAGLLSDYLYMYFNRPEFDRYARFSSWGSAREAFSWNDMCNIEIDLPSLPVQQKYVDVYNAMLQNQRVYESRLEDLQLLCFSYLDRLKNTTPLIPIGGYIEQVDNRGIVLGEEWVKGITTDKRFIDTRADLGGVSLEKYKVVSENCFAYVPDTSRRSERVSLAYNQISDTYLVSSISCVFQVVRLEKLIPEYLLLWFSRPEFDRYARFHSWGSAREIFSWDDMKNVEMPIPSLTIQQALANIYNVYSVRRELNEQLKAQIKDICPILIKGSLEEASA